MFNRIASMSLLNTAVYVLTTLLLTACTGAGSNYHRLAEGDSFDADKTIAHNYSHNKNDSLKILTLNIAHGRNQAANQLLRGKDEIEKNLVAIAEVLKKTDADIVALQEADGPSGWSGNFDHIEFLARESGYPWYYRANHAESWLFSYGTAVLSRLPVAETLQHTFDPSPPTLNKGFLLNRVNWIEAGPTAGTQPVDIVSVHLDFSRKRVRDAQIAEMTEVLARRDRPMIILGDFNSEWFAEESVIKSLAQQARMSVYRPEAKDMPTYKNRYRYDWILISEELTFISYQVLPDLISDHQAVLAEVRLKTVAEQEQSLELDIQADKRAIQFNGNP